MTLAHIFTILDIYTFIFNLEFQTLAFNRGGTDSARAGAVAGGGSDTDVAFSQRASAQVSERTDGPTDRRPCLSPSLLRSFVRLCGLLGV